MRVREDDEDEGEAGGLAYAGGRCLGPNMMCGGKRSIWWKGGVVVGTVFWN